MQREKVKATFFMLGENVERYPDAVRDVQATGSELANHSWNHPSLPGLSNSGMRSQLKRTSEEIEKVTRVRVTLMRPPYGANNQRLDQVTKKLGLAEIFWNVDTLDWKYQDTDRLVDYVLSNAGRDEVVLMHDIHESTVDGAQAIFRGLKKRGSPSSPSPSCTRSSGRAVTTRSTRAAASRRSPTTPNADVDT